MKYLRVELAKARVRSRLNYLIAEIGLLCKYTGCGVREVVLSVNEKVFAVPDTLTCPSCDRVLEVAYIRGKTDTEAVPACDPRASSPAS